MTPRTNKGVIFINVCISSYWWIAWCNHLKCQSLWQRSYKFWNMDASQTCSTSHQSCTSYSPPFMYVCPSEFDLWSLSAEISLSLHPIRPSLKNFHHGVPEPEKIIMPQTCVKLLEIQWTTNEDWPAFLSIEQCIVDKKFIVHKYLWRAATFLMSCSWPLIHY